MAQMSAIQEIKSIPQVVYLFITILNLWIYQWAGQLSARCDVYSFGVVLLEIVSGRRALDKTRAAPEDKLVDWIKLYVGDKRKIFRIMDTELKGQYSRKGAYLAINIARLCINDAKSRPPMGEVLELLEKIKVSKFEAKDSQSHQGGVDSSPAHKTPSRHNYPSPVNRTSKGSPMLSHTKSPLRSPRKKWAEAGYSNQSQLSIKCKFLSSFWALLIW